MSLEELRAISDIDMSDKDLAEVIQAIHAGGAQSDSAADINSATTAGAYSSAQQATDAWAQDNAHDCALCQHISEAPCTQCVLCTNTASNETLQAIADWLKWQHCFCDWISQQHPDMVPDACPVGATCP